MIRTVEALNYRCLHYIRAEIQPFQVLVGPNASGKSTFLDVIQIFGDLLQKGLKAIDQRSKNIEDIVWMGLGHEFEIAIEM